MDTTIFCPTCHRFIGQRDKCEHCNWTRPPHPSQIGRVTWETKLSAEDPLPGMPPFPARITSSNELAFVPTDTGDLVALDPATGRIQWQRPLRPDHKLRTLGVAVWKNLLLIGAEHLADLPTRDRSLLAWEATTGEEVWTWPTTGDSLSIPVVHQDVAYFASSEPKLYALDLNTRQLKWAVTSLTWSPEPPAVCGDAIVVPSRGPTVAAYALKDGVRLWTFDADDKETEWLHQRPAANADTVFVAGWDKRLYAVESASGKLRWKFQAERGITCPPVLAGDRLLLGVKDYRTDPDQRKPGYGLCAIDVNTGATVWRVHTDKHIHVPPTVSGSTVLCGADDRRLRALDAHDGRELWQIALPEKLRAGPHIVGDQVIVGQRGGTFVSIQWQATPPPRPDPAKLLAEGRPLDAAAELALAGQYETAARLFADNGELVSAAALYQEAHRPAEAAAIYVQVGELDLALSLYRQANERRGEADVLALQNKHDAAAPIYETLGELDLAVKEYIAAGRAGYAAQLLRRSGRRQEAARLYQTLGQDDQAAEILVEGGRHAEAAEVFQSMGKHEAAASVLAQGGLLSEAAALNERIGRTEQAAELYVQSGQTAQAIFLFAQLQDWQRVAELAEAASDLPHLGNALAQLGQTARAAQVYERAGLLDRALELYESLMQWEQVRQIAGKLKQWEKQACALVQMGLVSEAGEAYERAAEQLQAKMPLPKEDLARLYEEAAQCYAQDENLKRQQACWDKVCQLREWPSLRGRFEFSGPFVQGEFNQVRLTVRNVGYGMAHNIRVDGVGSKFKIDTTESDLTATRLLRLGPQQDKSMLLSLQSKPEVLGHVNLRVTLSYQDKTGQAHQDEIIQSVEVLGRDEKIAAIRQQQTPAAATPQVINVQGGRVVVGGTFIEGDQLGEGAQKGDRIESTPITGAMTAETGAPPTNLSRFFDQLDQHFSDAELRDVCFRLSVDYDELAGQEKASKARELISYLQRRDQLARLIDLCSRLRPNVSWQFKE